MFCPECGNHIKDQNIHFCPECGTKIEQGSHTGKNTPTPQSEGTGTHGLIFTNVVYWLKKWKLTNKI